MGEAADAGSGQSIGVNYEALKELQEILALAKEAIDKPEVTAPRAGLLGMGPEGQELKELMTEATDRITSALSAGSDAIIDFDQAVRDGVRSVEDSDQQAADAFNGLISQGLRRVDQPFFENLGKDDRPDMNVNLPFLPPGVWQKIASRSELGDNTEESAG